MVSIHFESSIFMFNSKKSKLMRKIWIAYDVIENNIKLGRMKNFTNNVI